MSYGCPSGNDTVADIVVSAPSQASLNSSHIGLFLTVNGVALSAVLRLNSSEAQVDAAVSTALGLAAADVGVQMIQNPDGTVTWRLAVSANKVRARVGGRAGVRASGHACMHRPVACPCGQGLGAWGSVFRVQAPGLGDMGLR